MTDIADQLDELAKRTHIHDTELLDLAILEIRRQRAEIAVLKAERGSSNEYVTHRYAQAVDVIRQMRHLADHYQRLLDGPPKD